MDKQGMWNYKVELAFRVWNKKNVVFESTWRGMRWAHGMDSVISSHSMTPKLYTSDLLPIIPCYHCFISIYSRLLKFKTYRREYCLLERSIKEENVRWVDYFSLENSPRRTSGAIHCGCRITIIVSMNEWMNECMKLLMESTALIYHQFLARIPTNIYRI